MNGALCVIAILTLAAAPASAERVQVDIHGTVEFSIVGSGLFADVVPGDAANISFVVDSENYVDSGSYNVRGYLIDNETFLMTLGSVSVGAADPYPGTPYFVLRDNDPVVDGFYFANSDLGGPDLTAEHYVDEHGQIAEWFGAHFEVSYSGDKLTSLDITEAYGGYGVGGLQSYYYGLIDDWADAMGYFYGHIEISPLVTGVPGGNRSESAWSDLKALF